MIDVVNLPDYTIMECNLDDLPSLIVERIKLHLLREETPYICIASRQHMGFEVYLTTYNRIIKSTVWIERKNLNFDSKNETTSIFFSEVIGLAHEEFGKNQHFWKLDVLCVSKKLELTFNDREIFSKFVNRILLTLNERQKNQN